jgi:uncharacterized membrane protein
MSFLKPSPFALWLAVVVSAIFSFSGTSAQAQDTPVDFAKDIKPLLESKCMRCHNEDRKEGGFRMDDREKLFDDWVFAEEASESPMMIDHILSTDKDQMMPPPPRKDPESDGPLKQAEIDLLTRWIDEGADWPDDVELVVLTEDPASAQEDGDKPKKAARVYNPDPYRAIGSLHPAVIHLPIGLLLAAGVFALLGLRGNFVMSDCAYYCLWLGTIGAILACVSGWWFSPMEGQGTVTEFKDLLNQDHPIFWHRTGGLIVTIVAFLLALFAAGARNRDPDDGFLWKLCLILLAGAIGWVGHEGGKLTHPKLYKDLNGASEAITGWDIDGNGAVDEWAEEASDIEDVSEDDDDQVGKTSEESNGDESGNLEEL